MVREPRFKVNILVLRDTFQLHGDRRGNILVAPDGRVVYLLLQSPLEVGNRFGATPESHLLAEIISALPADAALAAGDADLEGNTVAEVKARDLRANGDNDSRGLMAEGQRHAGAEVAVGELFVIGDIGAADTGCFYGYLQLANTRLLDAPSFL